MFFDEEERGGECQELGYLQSHRINYFLYVCINCQHTNSRTFEQFVLNLHNRKNIKGHNNFL